MVSDLTAVEVSNSVRPHAEATNPNEPNFDHQRVIFETSSLHGTVEVGGAKNCGPKLMIAACLASGRTLLKNMPVIGDVEVTAEVLRSLGADVQYGADQSIVIVIPDDINKWEVPETTGEASRISILAAGMLLARFGKADIPLPGGDKIGKRAIDIHLDGLKALGAKVDESTPGRIRLTAENGLRGCDFSLTKPSHTATENLIMASSQAAGTTTLRNCAREPEVDALIDHLNKSGAKIKVLSEDDSVDGRIIQIEGVKDMHGVETRVITDRNAVVTYAIAALTAGSAEGIFVKGAQKEHIATFLELVTEMGGKYEVTEGNDGGIRFFMEKGSKLTAPKRTVITCPHPGKSDEKYIGIMTDWQPLVSALLLHAEGDSHLIETMYSSRFHHLHAVNEEYPGAITFYGPREYGLSIQYFFPDDSGGFHAAVIHGGRELTPLKITGGDVRLGAFAALLGVVNGGELIGTRQIRRGYHRLLENLQLLGAKLTMTEVIN